VNLQQHPRSNARLQAELTRLGHYPPLVVDEVGTSPSHQRPCICSSSRWIKSGLKDPPCDLGSRASYWLGGMHPNPNACCLVSLQLGAGRDCGRGPVDPLDHYRLRGVAGTYSPEPFPACICMRWWHGMGSRAGLPSSHHSLAMA
jgi:hypothetical protein